MMVIGQSRLCYGLYWRMRTEMQTEWTVECGVDDPVLVIPWTDASGEVGFVDLSADPLSVDSICEAEAHPPLLQALRALNAARSPVFTAKCDAWEMSQDEVAQLCLELGIGAGFDDCEEEACGLAMSSETDAPAFGFASYIDCICHDRAVFASFPRHEHLLRGIVRMAMWLDHPRTALECVLRPAFVHLEAPRQGYAVSVYVKALDHSPQRAWKRWAAVLADVVALLRRSEDFC